MQRKRLCLPVLDASPGLVLVNPDMHCFQLSRGAHLPLSECLEMEYGLARRFTDSSSSFGVDFVEVIPIRRLLWTTYMYPIPLIAGPIFRI